MNPALVATGVLLIILFVVNIVRRNNIKEGFKSNICGRNNNEVYVSSAKEQTGPLQSCPVGSKLFYSQLARIKGTKLIDPKNFRFTLPGGIDPVKNLVPGTKPYNDALKKTGTQFLDPTNWSLITAVQGVTQAPPVQQQAMIVPTPKNTGSVPNTMPGSTTANSTDGLANTKDLIAFRDTLATFNKLFEQQIAKAAKSTDLQFLHANAISFGIKIQAQIDTGSIVDSQQFISTQRALYEKAIRDLRQGKIPGAVAPKPAPKVPIDTRVITLADVENAILRAKAEKKRIDNLRTTSGDLRKRATTLDRLILDLTGMVERIRRGTMKISELPFNRQHITKFLMEVTKADSSAITPFPTLKKAEPKPAPKKVAAAPTKPAAQVPGQFPLPTQQQTTNAIRQFQSAVKDLSWEINVGYDPKTTIHRETLERLSFIINQIEGGKVKGNLLKAYMLELETLKSQGARSNNGSAVPFEKFDQQQASTIDESFTINTQVPVKQELISNIDPSSSSDWRKRPGYEWTTETLAKRASMATFDESKVGGLDYKARAQHLCNQIRDAGLGEPSEFGCIKNPQTDVGPEYSWKGNHTMVCSRLSNTWGNWYPEMFGCPKQDISQIQTPVIRLDN